MTMAGDNQLTAIVAMTPERVIGRDGDLPWRLPEDLKFFKKATTGHAIVMGRKTYESIGRPLPKRRNIVMTRDGNWSAAGVEVIHGVEDLSRLAGLDGRVFIIGGAEIYQAFLADLEELWISHVAENHAGDTWFPEFEDAFADAGVIERHAGFEVRRWVRKR